MFIIIDADSGIKLANGSDGNRQRFAKVFGNVWQAIPDEDKQQILGLWRKGYANQASPLVQLSSSCELPAAVDNCGHHLYFNSVVSDKMPDEILAKLICHELAHVWHYAQPNSYAITYGATNQQKDDEADATANRWGFSMTNLRDWANNNADAIVKATGNENIGW